MGKRSCLSKNMKVHARHLRQLKTRQSRRAEPPKKEEANSAGRRLLLEATWPPGSRPRSPGSATPEALPAISPSLQPRPRLQENWGDASGSPTKMRRVAHLHGWFCLFLPGPFAHSCGWGAGAAGVGCLIVSSSLSSHGLSARRAPLSMGSPQQEYWNR